MESSIVEKNITEDPNIFRQKMLDWYDVHRRILPWRALKGQVADPYHVWLSEIMLQQTTVQAVIPYFLKFVKRWPDVHALASADNDELMAAWAGLGYYARARNLHKCAKVISEDLDGVFPCDEGELKKLPGIGDYTAAAIRSIAFNMPSVVVDGNVDRVMARYHAIDTPFPDGKKDVRRWATFYADGYSDRPADYAQSLMDLGATICTPKSPVCGLCPINDCCSAYAKGHAELYPKKAPKKMRPHKYGYVYWVTNNNGDVLIQTRPESGMLGGMLGLPTSDWVIDKSLLSHCCFNNIVYSETSVRHVFTHFSLDLFLYRGIADDCNSLGHDFQFVSVDKIDERKFPTLFKKAIRAF